MKDHRIIVASDAELRQQVIQEKARLQRELGMRVSLSATAEHLLRRGLEHKLEQSELADTGQQAPA